MWTDDEVAAFDSAYDRDARIVDLVPAIMALLPSKSYESVSSRVKRVRRRERELAVRSENGDIKDIVRAVIEEMGVNKTVDTTHTTNQVAPSTGDAPSHGRFVALFDLHFPRNINVSPVMSFIKDFSPDVLIIGGDDFDGAPFSPYNAGKAGNLIKEGFASEQIAAYKKQILEPRRAVVGDSCYICHMEGNHEDWLRQAMEREPLGHGFWNLSEIISGMYDGYVPYRAVEPNLFKLGKLLFMHGVYTNMYHAKKTVDAYERSVFYGHVHTEQTAIKVSAVDIRDVHKATSVPCLCHLNPHYARNRPNAWSNGFLYGEVDESGNWWAHVVHIIDGSFIIPGVRRYE